MIRNRSSEPRGPDAVPPAGGVRMPAAALVLALSLLGTPSAFAQDATQWTLSAVWRLAPVEMSFATTPPESCTATFAAAATGSIGTQTSGTCNRTSWRNNAVTSIKVSLSQSSYNVPEGATKASTVTNQSYVSDQFYGRGEVINAPTSGYTAADKTISWNTGCAGDSVTTRRMGVMVGTTNEEMTSGGQNTWERARYNSDGEFEGWDILILLVCSAAT